MSQIIPGFATLGWRRKNREGNNVFDDDHYYMINKSNADGRNYFSSCSPYQNRSKNPPYLLGASSSLIP